MIAVDTSALMAIVLDEPQAGVCAEALHGAGQVLLSAGTVAEALIVAGRRGVGEEMARLIDQFGFAVVNVTPASARRVADAYKVWGKGANAASLNFGDCFSYEVARAHHCRLLYVGEDFAKTDLRSVL